MAYPTGVWHDLHLGKAVPLQGVEVEEVYFLCDPAQIDAEGGITVPEGETVEVVSVEGCMQFRATLEGDPANPPKLLGYSGSSRLPVEAILEDVAAANVTIATHGPVFYEIRLEGPGRFSQFAAELRH